MNEFIAELNAEMTEEQIISECAMCNGSGIIRAEDDWGERAEECICLQKFHNEY